MEQIAKVVEKHGEYAIVTVQRMSSCGENCAQCKTGCTGGSVRARVYNTKGAAVGDTVRVETSTKSVLLATIFVYLFPVCGALFAAITAQALGCDSRVIVLFFVGVFFAFYVLVHFLDKKMAPKSFITQILYSQKKQ